MNTLEARRRLLGRNVYKRTTEGNPAIAQGSLARMYPGITMQGWTEQNGTPTPEAPVPIVSAGTQNQDTGKWEYEITIANAQTDPDKNQSVTLTSDRPLTKWDKLEKRNGQWGWVYKSAEIVLDGSEDEAWTVYNIGFKVAKILPEVMLMRESYCTQFTMGTGFNENSVWVGSNTGNRDIYFPNVPSYYDAELGDKGLGNFKQHVSENPLTILTYLDEETFVPLTETEQEQMNALYTFRPTTVLSNDCECDMALTYKTKKSLENLVGGV